MLLSCITTVFNEGPLLMTAVRSILGQTMGDFELLLVDDGSAAETISVLNRLKDPRIRVIRQANDGVSSARNRGLEQAKGDYVCFLDADDSRTNWAFSAVARLIEAHRPDMILTPGVLQDRQGPVRAFYDQPVFDRLPRELIRREDPDFNDLRCDVQHIEPQSANKFIARSFLQRSRLGFPNGQVFEDVFFHTGAVAMADSIAFLDTPSFCYWRRYGRASITASTGETRFQIIASARLTLDSFALLPEFADEAYRSAVLVSCLRVLMWCHHEISHGMRWDFQLACRAMFRLIDPGYRALPWVTSDGTGFPPGIDNPEKCRAFLSALEIRQ